MKYVRTIRIQIVKHGDLETYKIFLVNIFGRKICRKYFDRKKNTLGHHGEEDISRPTIQSLLFEGSTLLLCKFRHTYNKLSIKF